MKKFSDEKMKEIREKFPNVNDEEFEAEGLRRLKNQLGLWTKDVDWSDPTPEDVKNLREELECRDIDSFSFNSSENEVREFLESDDLSKEYIEDHADLIEDIGDTLADSPMEGKDVLDIAHQHVFRVVLSAGGPGSGIEFTVDKDGQLEGAEAWYAWGWKDCRMEIDYDIAEKLWQPFSYLSEDIEAQARQRDRMRY